MRRTAISPEGLLGCVILLGLSIQACIVVVDDDVFDPYYDDHLYRTHWHLDVFVYNGRTHDVAEGAYTLSFDSRSRLSGEADCNT